MVLISVTGIMILSFLIILCAPYKKKERKRQGKKRTKLWFVYGPAMFIVDRLPDKIVRNNQQVNRSIEKLTVKEDVEQERYIYMTDKAAMCIVALWVTLFLTLAVGISEKQEKNIITHITRDEKTDREYSLQIDKNDGGKEQVTLHVARKQYTEKQIEKIFNKRKSELIKAVLGKNESQDKVSQNLNLVTEIGEEEIFVSWTISDSSKISYDGELSEKIAKEGEAVTLTATMTLEKNTCDYSFTVNVFPPQKTERLGEQLQEYVNGNEKDKVQVKLPDEIDGEKVHYRSISSKISGYVLIIGFIISVGLFFLKDKELKKQVEERNRQLFNDYPEIVSKILLYYSAGLSIRGTIERIVKAYEEEKADNAKWYRYGYEELSMCLMKMKSGVSEISAMNQYGARCKLHCYIKLAGLMEQNMRRGTKELSLVLKGELKEAMNEKKNQMLRNGGQISTKLLGPMVIMLLIAIVIIMVPAFMSMGF